MALVHRFDGEWPARFEGDLMRYLSVDPRLGEKCLSNFKNPLMTKENFQDLADEFRSPHLWKKTSNGWTLKHIVE